MATAFVLKAKRYVTSYRIDGLLSHAARPLFLLLLLGRKQKGQVKCSIAVLLWQLPPDFGNFTARLIKAQERRELHTMASQ